MNRETWRVFCPFSSWTYGNTPTFWTINPASANSISNRFSATSDGTWSKRGFKRACHPFPFHAEGKALYEHLFFRAVSLRIDPIPLRSRSRILIRIPARVHFRRILFLHPFRHNRLTLLYRNWRLGRPMDGMSGWKCGTGGDLEKVPVGEPRSSWENSVVDGERRSQETIVGKPRHGGSVWNLWKRRQAFDNGSILKSG